MKKVRTWVLVIGWISAVLGGLIGIFIGAHIASVKATGPDGVKTYKYDDWSRKQGVPMVVIGLIVFAVGLWLRVNG